MFFKFRNSRISKSHPGEASLFIAVTPKPKNMEKWALSFKTLVFVTLCASWADAMRPHGGPGRHSFPLHGENCRQQDYRPGSSQDLHSGASALLGGGGRRKITGDWTARPHYRSLPWGRTPVRGTWHMLRQVPS